MKKLVLAGMTLSILAGCQFAPQGDYLRPSDVVADKNSLLGQEISVTGYLACNSDFCQLYEGKSRMGIPEGAKIGVKIDELPSADKKFVIKKCTISADETCALQVTGTLKKGALPSSPDLVADAIHKLGITGLMNAI
ncbi:hypothetical protein MO867_12245 [Microbulbifer sp. OS29]|uniref:Lipoprotein n=1 Tax=Microbulbifer okhotskensis TaxID=2926617 RepID=A0A9X2EMS2_9GAMM|nr:hypothetical protein [Microbulbifer okhotskensis]MCO1335102.1 hypothetical protein [Microbulbifer okhotskensis]